MTTDPIPHARRSPMEHERDAPDLAERVAQLTADHCCADSVESWERELARAIVAMVLDEAAKVAEKRTTDALSSDHPYNEGWRRSAKVITAAIRALLPEAKP